MTTDLEDRLRETLRMVAAATPTGAVAAPRPLRRWPAAVAAAAFVAAAVAGGVYLRTGDEQVASTPGSTDGPAKTSSPVPAGFDVTEARPVFAADGDADAVAAAFMASRFPDFPVPGVRLEPVVDEGGVARARWETSGPTEGPILGGDLFLRQVDGRWGVVAATTDAVDMSDVAYDGQRITGTVRTTDINSLVVEVRDWRGDLADDTTSPNTFGPADTAVTVDRAHTLAPATVRVMHIGGTVLSIAEIRLEPPPLAPHRDLQQCLAAHSTPETERTFDALVHLCTAALQGTVIGTAASPPSWELVASDESSGHWVTLRSHDQVGTYRVQTDGAFPSIYTQLGPCCSIGGHVAVAGTLRRGTTGMRVVLADGTAFAAAGHPDPTTGAVHAVALVPASSAGSGSPARVEVRLADGTFEDAGVELDLTVLGG